MQMAHLLVQVPTEVRMYSSSVVLPVAQVIQVVWYVFWSRVQVVQWLGHSVHKASIFPYFKYRPTTNFHH